MCSKCRILRREWRLPKRPAAVRAGLIPPDKAGRHPARIALPSLPADSALLRIIYNILKNIPKIYSLLDGLALRAYLAIR